MVFNKRWQFGAYHALIYHQYSDPFFMKVMSMLYVLTDSVALFMVPKLPKSTIVHHYISVFFAFMTWSWDLGTDIKVVHLIFIYGMFSTLSYLVNFFLAMRVLLTDISSTQALFLDLVCGCALIIYLLSCIGNWIFHLVWLTRFVVDHRITLEVLLYCSILYFVIRDDIILIKWLWSRFSQRVIPVTNSLLSCSLKQFSFIQKSPPPISPSISLTTTTTTTSSSSSSSSPSPPHIQRTYTIFSVLFKSKN
jgi:hypothetical protein